jgi:predicted DNA binding CopG/RHH family protein
MSSNLLSANLGDLHPLLRVMSALRQQTPSESLLDLISAVIKQDNSNIQRIKTERIRFAAGDLYTPFKTLCKHHGASPNIMFKALVLQELTRLLRQGDHQRLQANNRPTTFEAQAHVGLTDRKRHRIGLRISNSELDQLRHLAQQRGTSVQRLIVQIIRAFLLNTNAFSPQESAALGAINLSLMRIGGNLNQIAKRLNAYKEQSSNVIALNDIATCVQQINNHVRDCSRSLQLSRERWRIELRS